MKKSLTDLVKNITDHGASCDSALNLVSVKNCKHVIKTSWTCNKEYEINWTYSSEMGGDFAINYKAMLAYLCSGMQSISYEKFSEFFDCGVQPGRFRSKSAITFSAVISLLVRQSTEAALAEETARSKKKKKKKKKMKRSQDITVVKTAITLITWLWDTTHTKSLISGISQKHKSGAPRSSKH